MAEHHRQQAAAPVREAGSSKGRKSATIMMVDDEPTTIEVIEMILQSDGCENFMGITNSRRALSAIARERPDLLLLDLLIG